MAGYDSVENLLQRISQDDAAAFEEIFQRYHQKVYAFAVRLLPSAPDAEEVVQNVFMAIWNQRKAIVITGSFQSYLFGIAHHLVCDFITRKVQHEAFVNYQLEGNPEYAFVTEDEVLFRELEGHYNALIDSLPERRRQIFLLSRVEGLSYKEIAQRLDISENTVDTQIRHVLDYLRARLTDR